MARPGSHTDRSLPADIDTSQPSIARAYNAALGGKDNYAADRAVIERLRAVAPEVEQMAVDHRAFLIRVTRFVAARTGVTQFLDCGSGLPSAENTHEAAQRIRPDARVVYVDNDPTVVAHGRALLEENDRTVFVPADIFTPRDVLDDPTVRKHLDFAEPIALFQLGTLHHHAGSPTPQEVMAEYVDALPSGSYVALTHFLDPEDGGEVSGLARRMEGVFLRSPLGAGYFRTRPEIEAMFPPGLEMVPPGLVECAEWWPDGPHLRPLTVPQRAVVGGIARKP